MIGDSIDGSHARLPAAEENDPGPAPAPSSVA
jgi:hypothetical protein